MTDSYDEQREALAEASNQSVDPLAGVGDTLDAVGIDPFDFYIHEVLREANVTDATQYLYSLSFDQWKAFMTETGRHPACPNAEHVERFIRTRLAPKSEGGTGNAKRTVREKLRRLERAYRYWQQDPAFPHPKGYNPFELARVRVCLSPKKEKQHRRVPIEELRAVVSSIPNLRAQAIVCMQCKLGLRAGELANIRLGDVKIARSEASTYYSELGQHEQLADYDNLLYVPAGSDRSGNKSKRPRLLPLDRELRDLLNRYLLVRPKNGEQWLFLSKKSHTQLNNSVINEIWKTWFHPEYAETDEYRPITSHFGRHRFTTYWRVEQDLNRQLVKYLRGDQTGTFTQNRGMDAYLHAYYEDIEEIYRERVFNLLV